MRRRSKFNDLQEKEGLRFKSLYFKKDDNLIEAFSYSLSNDQRQLTLRSKAPELGNKLLYQGKLTLGPANTTVTESDDYFREQEIQITIAENTVFVLLDDEEFYECTKIKYPFDTVVENLQVLCCKSRDYIEITMDRAF